MEGGLLSLKWNNHRSTLFHMLSTVRKKENYTDVTLACDGKFYSVHKLVLSMCSEYFDQMFQQTQCKHPVIVLKDIKSDELESLLSYMYVGEVNVVQEKLSGLIKAAECLRIKGLAVPDEEPCSKTSTSREKRSSDNSLNSEPKRRRQDDSGNTSSFRQAHSNNRNDDRRKSLDHPSSSSSNKFRNSNSSNSNVNSTRPSSGDRESGDRGSTSSRTERLASPSSNNQHHAAPEVKTEEQVEAAEAEALEEVMIEEPPPAVKEEPTDADAVYLSDSNSVPDTKDDVLLDSFTDAGQQHFMDELLGQTSESNSGNMGVGDYSEGGEGSSGAGSQQQQHMVSGPEAGFEQLQLHPGFDFPSGALAPFRTTSGTHNSDAASSQHFLGGGVDRDVTTWPRSGAQEPYSAAGGMRLIPATQIQQRRGIGSLTPAGGVPLTPFDELPPKQPNTKYCCPVCFKQFKIREHFRVHYRIHTGEKPFACTACSYRSAQSCALKYHMHKYHATQD